MFKSFVAIAVSFSLIVGLVGCGASPTSAQTTAPKAATQEQTSMDSLLAPIALYPDALLAQVLACASSPQQVTEVNKWLAQNKNLQGTELQQAAEAAGFDAAFIAIVLFPDVLKLLGENMPWTTELGTAFTSNQKAVLESVQRLRAQAVAVGNLKTTPQQEVKTETQSGQTVIVVQPANPQVVYVPQYNPQTVYTAPPPAQDNSGQVAAAAAIGFIAGIALGAAANNNSYYGYHGYSAWGMHWHSTTVIVHGGAWRVPPYPRYPYARPMPAYRAPVNVYAPRYSNANVNVNRNVNVNNNVNVNRNVNVNNNVNANRNVNTTTRTPRPTTVSTTAASNRSTAARPTSTASPRASTSATRSRAQGGTTATGIPAGQIQRGAGTSAFSGYQNGASTKASSARGRSSSSGSTRGRSRN